MLSCLIALVLATDLNTILDDPKLGEQAASTLGALGPRGEAALLRGVADKREPVRLAALRGLAGRPPGTALLTHLVALLKERWGPCSAR